MVQVQIDKFVANDEKDIRVLSLELAGLQEAQNAALGKVGY